MNQPLFSVIIPTYNRAERLQIALDSLANQKFKNFEVLVCDDGSTDNSREIVDKFKEILDLTYIWDENWGGPARPRNNGLKVAKANWVCFLDSDDWWYPEKLEMCSKYLNDYDVIYHNLQVYTSHGKLNQLIKGRQLQFSAFDDLVVNRNAIPTSSAVVKKEIIFKAGHFSEDRELIAIEDYDLWINISKFTSKFYFLPTVLGSYFISGFNISNDFEKRNYREEYVFNKYKNNLTAINKKKGMVVLNNVIANNYILNNNNKYIKHLLYVLYNGNLRNKLKAVFYLICGKTYLKYIKKQVF